MSLRIYDVEQRSPEWFEARRGIVTASTVGRLITPSTLKAASNDKSRALIWTLAAERITGWTEETYQTSDMLRGVLDEPVARAAYSEHYAPVTACGFMVNDDTGYRIGYSPDGLVGTDGLIEVKSGRPKEHLKVVVEDQVPPEHMAQIQAGLLVSGRRWCDYVRIAGGMALWVKRVHPLIEWVNAIETAVAAAEADIAQCSDTYRAAVTGLPMTEKQTYDMDVIV